MSYDSRNYYRPMGFGGFTLFPPVIKKLLIINIAVFFIQVIFENLSFGGYPGWYVMNRYFALNPLTGIDQAGNLYNFQVWQLLTYQFMHGGFSHIFFNMLMLWMFGMEIENIMGSKKFLFFYLFSGIGAGVFNVLLAPVLGGALAPTIGASGAVFGVMLAFAMYFPNRPIYLYFLIPVRAKYLIGFLVIVEFMSVGSPSLVAHLAHIGGVLSALIFLLLDRHYRFNFNSMFSSIKKKSSGFSSGPTFKRTSTPFRPANDSEVREATFFDLNDEEDKFSFDQTEIDRILDKISRSGYQNLTDEEKRILFEASKKS